MVNRVGDFGFILGIFAIFRHDRRGQFRDRVRAAPSLAGKTILSSAIIGMRRPSSASCCSSAPWVSRRSSCCTPGFPTRWKARPPCRPHPCRDHGDRRRVHGGAHVAHLRTLPHRARSDHARWGHDGHVRGDHRLVQNDIKKVIAYSTCSQLGYMFVAMGAGAYSIGVFHLFTMPASRRCSSSAPARSSMRCTTSRICAIWAGWRRRSPIPTP